jgi:hypothetical protein
VRTLRIAAAAFFGGLLATMFAAFVMIVVAPWIEELLGL